MEQNALAYPPLTIPFPLLVNTTVPVPPTPRYSHTGSRFSYEF